MNFMILDSTAELLRLYVQFRVRSKYYKGVHLSTVTEYYEEKTAAIWVIN